MKKLFTFIMLVLGFSLACGTAAMGARAVYSRADALEPALLLNYAAPGDESGDEDIPDVPKNGLVKDEDGVMRYYTDGEVDASASGIARLADGSDDNWYYIENGVFKASSGIAQKIDRETADWYYVENGVYKKASGIAQYADGSSPNWYYVQNGKYKKATGIARYADGSSSNWYYVQNGKYKKASGIARYADRSSPDWYYVQNGKYKKASGIARYADRSSPDWYYVQNGKYKKATGIARYADRSTPDWYYVQNGRYEKETGIARKADRSNPEWYYVKNGRYRSEYTGLAPRIPDGKLFYVKDGRYRDTYDGTVKYGGRLYIVTDGAAGNSVDPNKPMVALTYDDGPNRSATMRILDSLEKYDGRATFFVVGSRVGTYSDCVERAFDMGCEIGNHTYDHTILTSVSASTMRSQLSRTSNAVKDVTGVGTALMRPPGGGMNSSVRANCDYPMILWSVDTLDWKTRSASATITSVKDSVRDGSIVLMHDLYDSTAEASETIIPWLTNKGYQLVTVSELMAFKGIELKDGTAYYSGY